MDNIIAIYTREQAIADGVLVRVEEFFNGSDFPEILLEALNWSGIGSRFNPDLFGKIISAYKEAGGVIEHDSVTASYHCILSDWVNWLMYNGGRWLVLENAEQRATGEKQVEYVLSTLQRIMDHVPYLLSVANPRAL